METVTVGCKLPSGLHLNAYIMEDASEPVMGGGTRMTKVARFAKRVTIKGVGRAVDASHISYGAALTHGVDAEVWASWLAANKDSDIVKKGIVFAATKLDDTKSQARLAENEKTGLEPVNPNDLPREFVGKIEKAKAA